MRTIIYILIVGVLLSSCKKSREARQLERYISDTTWEFYYALDADGNDITAQVLADSLICTQFTFKKNDRDASTFNTIVEDCHNTYYLDYRGNWVVTDWKKIERKENLMREDFTNGWKEFGVAIGNIGTENGFEYLNQISFTIDEDSDDLQSPRFKKNQTGILTDTLLETRFYRKIN